METYDHPVFTANGAEAVPGVAASDLPPSFWKNKQAVGFGRGRAGWLVADRLERGLDRGKAGKEETQQPAYRL
jgi:hypothetical protein